MYLNRIWIVTLFLMAWMFGFTQTLSPKVVPAQGGYFIGNNLQLQYTIGQPINATYTLPGKEFSLGFEQPEMNLVIDSMPAGPFCAGSNFNIHFSTKGIIGTGNIFIAQLSDSAGNFATAVNAGADTELSSSIIKVAIPFTVTGGNNYKVRVISSKPLFAGGASIAFNITKIGIPSGIFSQSVCSDTAYTFVFDSIIVSAGGNQIEWATDSNFTQPYLLSSVGGYSFTLSPSSDSIFWLRTTNTDNLCLSNAISFEIDVNPLPHFRNAYLSDTLVLKDSSTTVIIPNAERGVRYSILKNDSLALLSQVGNNDTLFFELSFLQQSNHYKIIASDTNYGCSQFIDSFTISVFSFLPFAKGLSELLDSDATFFELDFRARSYLDSLKTYKRLLGEGQDGEGDEDEDEDGVEAQYGRWYKFFARRYTPDGKISHGYLMAAKYESKASEFSCTGSNNANWRSVGPINSYYELCPGFENRCSPNNLPQNQGRITAVAIAPDNTTIYAGGQNGGLFKSSDAGQTWNNITDNGHFVGQGIGCIKLHPANPNIIFISFGSLGTEEGTNAQPANYYGSGIWLSLDGGASWQQAGINPDPTIPYTSGDVNHYSITKFIVDPASTLNSTTIFAIAGSFIHKVTISNINLTNNTFNAPLDVPIVDIWDATATIPFLYTFQHFSDLKYDNVSNALWAAGPAFVIRTQTSTEILNNTIPANNFTSLAGTKWIFWQNLSAPPNYSFGALSSCPFDGSHVNEPNCNDVTLSIANNGTIYAQYNYSIDCGNSTTGFITHSSNYGISWSLDANPGTISPFFIVNPLNPSYMYSAGMIQTDRMPKKSLNSGTTFGYFNNYDSYTWGASFHPDIRDLELTSPSINGTDQLLVGNDGGIAICSDGNTWTNLNNSGLDIGLYYGCAISENHSWIAAGAQDGSLDLTDGKKWIALEDQFGENGDRGDCVFYGSSKTYFEAQNGGAGKILAFVYNGNSGQQAFSMNFGVTVTGGAAYILPEIEPDLADTNSLFVSLNYIEKIKVNSINSPNIQDVTNVSSRTIFKESDWNDQNNDNVYLSHVSQSLSNPNVLYASKYGSSNGTVLPSAGGLWQGVQSGGIYNWINISSGLVDRNAAHTSPDPLKPLNYSPITSHCVDPLNENRIFVTFGGFYEDNQGTNYKVFAGTYDAATSLWAWVNMSDGLPNLPVNCIIYQRGSDDLLYIGTDAGVFWWDKPNHTWQKYCSGLPDVMVYDLKIRYCDQTLTAATFGRGIWQANLITGRNVSYTLPTTPSNPVWSVDMQQVQTVIIPNGVTLTITATINMAAGTNIIVQPGGKLIVDGGTLTNFCGGTWGGIINMGNPSKSQAPITGNGATGTYYQGGVFLTGATIENATAGVQCGVVYPVYQTGGGGGIIQAAGSSFINNDADVVITNYKNFSSRRTLLPNASRFRNCTFSTTAVLNDGHSPSQHALLWSVGLVTFGGCIFKNTLTTTIATYDYQLGDGIKALDAGLNVGDYCTANRVAPLGCLPGTHCQFNNLRHGVYTATAFSAQTTTVSNAVFNNCIRGIRNEGSNMAHFTGNNIAVGNDAIVTDDAAYPNASIDEGILLHQCTGFTVEGNNIYANAASGSAKIGIRADGTGAASNQISTNSFGLTNNQGLNIANLGLRQNRSTDIFHIGLQYLCNQQKNNLMDLLLPLQNNDANNIIYGIQTSQGSYNKPAGNTFTALPISNIFNSQPNISYYFNTDLGIIPDAYPAIHSPYPLVKPILIPKPSTCQLTTTIGTSGFLPMLSGLSGAELQTKFDANDAIFNDAQVTYKSLIDTGNTSGLVTFLKNNDFADQSTLVLSTLLGVSPWLSDSVLAQASLNFKSISNVNLFNIFYANTDALNDTNMINLAKYRGGTVQVMADSLIDSLINHLDAITMRTILKDSITDAYSYRNSAAYEMVSRIMQDTDSVSYDSLRIWLYHLSLPMADAQIATSYIETGDLDSASNIIKRIYTKYLLTAYDSSRLNNLDSVLSSFVIPWYDVNDSTLMFLDTGQVQQLSSFATNSNEHLPGTNAARNILSVLYAANYYTPPILPTSLYSNRMDITTANTSDTIQALAAFYKGEIRVFPNPANNYVSFMLDTADVNSELLIYNLYGQLMWKKNLAGQLQTNVNTEAWGQGIYVWVVKQNEYPTGQGKLEIIK